MDQQVRATAIRSIFADELQNYLQKHRESDYLLVDVREPAEYKDGHIPGAKLLPLGQIEGRLDELDANRELLFYCASGRRSRIAATFVAESKINPHAIIDIQGGYFAWNGKEMRNFPRVKIFTQQKNITETLTTAIDLEKGAWRFYQALQNEFPDSGFGSAATTLVKLEYSHAEVIYRFLARYTKTEILPPFEELFAQLSGNILESGESFEEALQKAKQLNTHECVSFADLALDIEYNAYDLYRTLSHERDQPEEKEAFLQLAQQEKGHIRLITNKLETCLAS